MLVINADQYEVVANIPEGIADAVREDVCEAREDLIDCEGDLIFFDDDADLVEHILTKLYRFKANSNAKF